MQGNVNGYARPFSRDESGYYHESTLDQVEDQFCFVVYVNQFSDQGLEIKVLNEGRPVSKPDKAKIDQFIRGRRKEKDHLTLERFRETELDYLKGFCKSVWDEFEAIIGAIEKALIDFQESERPTNPMAPANLSEASQKALYGFLKDKGAIESDFENFRAVITGQPFYHRINWKGSKALLKRLLLWIHNNQKQDSGRWIPFSHFAATCFNGIDSKGLPDGIQPFCGPELRELEKRTGESQ